MDCSPPDSSGHGILQARILEWVAIPFFRGSILIQGLNPEFPTLPADSLPFESLEKPQRNWISSSTSPVLIPLSWGEVSLVSASWVSRVWGQLGALGEESSLPQGRDGWRCPSEGLPVTLVVTWVAWLHETGFFFFNWSVVPSFFF